MLLLEDSVRWPKVNWVQVTHSQLWPWMLVGYLDACGLPGCLWVTWMPAGYMARWEHSVHSLFMPSWAFLSCTHEAGVKEMLLWLPGYLKLLR